MSPISSLSLITLVIFVSCALFSVQGCPQQERKALLTFKSTLNDTNGILTSWKGVDCCLWNGVECNELREGRYVSKLDLRDFGLWSESGDIDSSLIKLEHLDFLDLSGNYFHGEISSHLGRLSSLHYLDLSYYLDDIYLTSSNLQWLSNLSSLEYLSLSSVAVSDKSWGSVIGSLRHLQHLDLSFCSLPAPTIPGALLNASSLTSLDLSGNSFSNIPTWMGILSYLTHLDLHSNIISGSIDNNIGNLTHLEYLDLSNNAIASQIPSSVGSINKLRKLFLYNNRLTGGLPLSFAHLSSLTYLDVSNNRLNGIIPSALMLPSSLQKLNLSNNNMNGTITEVFFQKSLNLERLDLSQSGLNISISSTWIPSFQLTTLLVEECQIGGPIPSWIITQLSLVELDLSSNQLVGNIPSWLWDIDLDMLRLSDNHLEGSFTATSRSLRYLDLSKNELSGLLPADIHVRLSNAEVLILADNKFEGQIPTSIVSLTNLSILDMSGNSLRGNIPGTLGILARLQVLNLGNNDLEGEIPRELGNLSYLESLRIGKNSLEGIIPSSLSNCSGLQVLDVGENNLIGNIPHWIANFSSLHVLVLRYNNFEGNLPSKIGRMPKLQVLDLSFNSFTGAIPHSYLRLPAMRNRSVDGGYIVISSGMFIYNENIDLIIKGQKYHYEFIYLGLTSIDLSNNILSGPLPAEIENLKGLLNLNISRNSLNGSIPETLGNMVQLESLDLSSNKFSGEIPWQLRNLLFLAYLNLSYNNLSGRIPLGGQLLTFDDSSYIGNPDLWGCPLKCSPPSPDVGSPPPSPQDEDSLPPPDVGEEDKREEDFEFSWFVMCLGLSAGVGFSGVMMVLVLVTSWRMKIFAVMDKMIAEMDTVICIALNCVGLKAIPLHVR